MSAALRVVVTDANLLPLRDELVGLLPAGTEVSWAVGVHADELTAALRTADVLVGPALTPEMAEAAPGLRLVHVAGAGTDRVDPAALRPGITVANTFHHEGSIAEYAVWAAIDLRRDLRLADAALREGRWRSSVYDRGLPQVQTLGAARVGFVGFGHIGSACWQAMSAFGASGRAVTGSGRVDAEAAGLDWAGTTDELPRLLAESDVVVVSVPLDDRTRGMIGARELGLLGPGGVLVNVARGPVVEEQALYDALRAGTIHGAAVDVWYSYPGPDGHARPAALPFHELENVLMTPHLSGVTRQTFLGRVQDIAANITHLAEGRALERVVAPQPQEASA
ncbi:2-hydroxyacid dehydrogenase [Krasilnikoviella flava]|uniref:Phosphoglycerate dehydrogenase n=1 Tax=Krasilnikoviella flava TaxID=526729 RepID=A0A1T5KQX8_9MICO|nr:2-hydroxyacid dehydrogenase [Krasilnikoviella flava]SKC66174.1 Phosphoglycerate dehydrogenase [Krasilnikoviella flava]